MQANVVSPASLGGLALYEYTPIADLSVETAAFSGTVYDTIAKKPLGTLTNQGLGGCHVFHGRTPEDQERWNAACREFTPIPWAEGEYAGQGEWELDEALSLLSESAITLMDACGEGEVKFFAEDPRAVVDAASRNVVTASVRPGKISATALCRLATDAHDEFGTLVFGMRSMSKRGGVNVFVTETVDADGERSPSNPEEESHVD